MLDGYIPRQVLFIPPGGATHDCPSQLLDWTGGGYVPAKKRDRSVPLQIGNNDLGYGPVTVCRSRPK